jgi:hypothetical protein
MKEGFVQAVGVASVEPEERYGSLHMAEMRILKERVVEILLRLQSCAESWNSVAGFVEAEGAAC